jgi:hypothetical protein
MEMKHRLIITVVLSLIIISCVAILYHYKDVAFMSNVNLTYPDGCVERYINGELVSQECTEGRRIAEQQEVLKSSANANTNLPWLINGS